MKKRINKITADVFDEVHEIKKAMPGLTAKTVAEILKGRGAVEGIGVSTVNALLRFDTFDEYKRYNEARMAGNKGAREAKPAAAQTEIDLQIMSEEKPRMSEAAREMIENQRRILEGIRRTNDILDVIVCKIFEKWGEPQ